MNPAPCIPIEQVSFSYNDRNIVDVYRTRAQIRKGLLRVWPPGSADYFLWIAADITWPGKARNSGARWWQPPVS